ncbi:NADH-quinone oxidoreductase subunit L [candidate division KSB1 bacterium]
MELFLYPIIIPAAAGFLLFFFPKKANTFKAVLAFLATVASFVYSVLLYNAPERTYSWLWFKIENLSFTLDFRVFGFGIFALIFINLFGLLVSLFSIGYFRGKDISTTYSSFVLFTIAGASGAVLANNLFLLLIFWEIVTLMLFLLTNSERGEAAVSAGKSFIILGFSDACLFLSMVLTWIFYGTLNISELNIVIGESWTTFLFILMFIAAITKAGAMPFHSWVPAISTTAPTTVMALLPASLDKLLGIYLLARISLDIFTLNAGLKLIMMIVGAVTILFAVMMALVQHDLKKLLSFHAVSQVGYMVLGIGTGTTIGIIGGLFHMLNNAIYKGGLFLGAAAIEKQTGTTDLASLGGLARKMPVTFFAMFIAAFSISGIPPLNGFTSKWLIYQSTVEINQPVFLIVAVFGSALTLASFIKVLHSVFFGLTPSAFLNIKEIGMTMKLPMVFLALLCILFGIFPQLPINNFINPYLGLTGLDVFDPLNFSSGYWNPQLAAILLISGLILGVLFYYAGKMKAKTTRPAFIGGEPPHRDIHRFPGTNFYKTITDMGILKTAFQDGQQGVYDIYNLVGKLGYSLIEVLRKIHTGVLSVYLSWCIIGLGFIIFLLLR